MSTINTEFARIWADALRSGEYKQGQGHLANETSDKFCCLGVLCELAVKANVIPKYDPEGTWHPYPQYGNERTVAVLPLKVAEWVNLRDDQGDLDECPVYGGTALTIANDQGMTFGRIADLIDAMGGVSRAVPES